MPLGHAVYFAGTFSKQEPKTSLPSLLFCSALYDTAVTLHTVVVACFGHVEVSTHLIRDVILGGQVL